MRTGSHRALGTGRLHFVQVRRKETLQKEQFHSLSLPRAASPSPPTSQPSGSIALGPRLLELTPMCWFLACCGQFKLHACQRWELHALLRTNPHAWLIKQTTRVSEIKSPCVSGNSLRIQPPLIAPGHRRAFRGQGIRTNLKLHVCPSQCHFGGKTR